MSTSITPIRQLRRLGGAAALVAVALTLGGCSGGPAGADAPADADVDTFCSTIGTLDVSDPERLIDDLVDIGTPEGIPDDARAGFEVMIDEADADEISAADQAKVTAFLAYVTSTCGAFPAADPSE